jgi:asparagine synthetase B (glutamine-hydrolysing)
VAGFWAAIARDDEPIRPPAPFAAVDRIATAVRGPLRIHLFGIERKQSVRARAEWRDVRIAAGETTITLVDGELSLDVPFSATTCLFARTDSHRIYLSTDPRLLARSTDPIDDRALYSVLQFGAIAPPFTMWRPVFQLTSGRVWTVSDTLTLHWAALRSSPRDFDPASEPRETTLTTLIDGSLRAMAPDERPVVCFSGGVDSGILAWRAARMGWRDTVLVHLSRGPTDDQTFHAERMAAALGLPFVVAQDDATSIERLLEIIGSAWYQPFGDCSVVSTAVLTQSILDQLSDRQSVLDGVGADGCFGLAPKARQWQRICSLPTVLRNAAAGAYGLRKVYGSAGRLEHVLRIARRAARMPYPLGAVAQNALHGIAYDFDPAVVEDVWRRLLEWNDSAATDDRGAARLASLDIGLTCSRMFAQKTRALFDASPMEIHHPFLASRMVEFALQTAGTAVRGEEPKANLKRLLAREVPEAQPYRAKSGFPLSVQSIFAAPSFLAALAEIISGRSPLAGIVRPDVVRRLRERIVAGRALNWPARNFLWTAVFTHLWLQQVKCGGHADVRAAAAPPGTARLVCTA